MKVAPAASRTVVGDFEEVVRDHKKLLEDAFTVYLSDLKAARDAFPTRLGVSQVLRNVDRELSFVERYLGYAK